MFSLLLSATPALASVDHTKNKINYGYDLGKAIGSIQTTCIFYTGGQFSQMKEKNVKFFIKRMVDRGTSAYDKQF